MATETRISFICSFCGLTKSIKLLSSELAEKADLETLERSIDGKEKLVADLREQFMLTIDDVLATALSNRISTEEKELSEMIRKAEKSKREICSLCVSQGMKRVVDPTTFTCEFCKQEKKGGGLKRHIIGWESRGIFPYRIATVCRQCQIDYAFTAPNNFYCPLTSDGRDYEGARGISPFDCSCEVPRNKRRTLY